MTYVYSQFRHTFLNSISSGEVVGSSSPFQCVVVFSSDSVLNVDMEFMGCAVI